MANIFYNRIIRKLVVGFGNLFDNITLVRYNPDDSEAERFIVPIAYAAKELYVQRIEGDANLDKKVQMTLPRMSFEMVGLSYDTSRKQNTNFKTFSQTSSGVLSQYNPVPYNFDFNLYLYVRNIEDGTQIIEHILPYFTPDYTIKLNLIPEMGIVKEIPVVLNSTSHETTYEGPRESDPRMIIWTLNFTVKGYVFGAVSSTGLIQTSITNILNDITEADIVQFNLANTGFGIYQTGEVVYQGYTINSATATAKVVVSSNNQISLTNINGNFVSNQPIIGAISNANYLFTGYTLQPTPYAQIITTSEPTDANASTLYTYTNQIYETPNTNPVVVNTNNFSGDLSQVFGKDDLQIEQENPIDLGS
jgi:T4-like virus Myoviridae tail sheath stabiliser